MQYVGIFTWCEVVSIEFDNVFILSFVLTNKCVKVLELLKDILLKIFLGMEK